MSPKKRAKAVATTAAAAGTATNSAQMYIIRCSPNMAQRIKQMLDDEQLIRQPSVAPQADATPVHDFKSLIPHGPPQFNYMRDIHAATELANTSLDIQWIYTAQPEVQLNLRKDAPPTETLPNGAPTLR